MSRINDFIADVNRFANNLHIQENAGKLGSRLVKFFKSNSYSATAAVVATNFVAFEVLARIAKIVSNPEKNKQLVSKQTIQQNGIISVVVGLSTYVGNSVFRKITAYEMHPVLEIALPILAGVWTILKLTPKAEKQPPRNNACTHQRSKTSPVKPLSINPNAAGSGAVGPRHGSSAAAAAAVGLSAAPGSPSRRSDFTPFVPDYHGNPHSLAPLGTSHASPALSLLGIPEGTSEASSPLTASVLSESPSASAPAAPAFERTVSPVRRESAAAAAAGPSSALPNALLDAIRSAKKGNLKKAAEENEAIGSQNAISEAKSKLKTPSHKAQTPSNKSAAGVDFAAARSQLKTPANKQ
jgi:hypothetical protein